MELEPVFSSVLPVVLYYDQFDLESLKLVVLSSVGKNLLQVSSVKKPWMLPPLSASCGVFLCTLMRSLCQFS